MRRLLVMSSVLTLVVSAYAPVVRAADPTGAAPVVLAPPGAPIQLHPELSAPLHPPASPGPVVLVPPGDSIVRGPMPTAPGPVVLTPPGQRSQSLPPDVFSQVQQEQFSPMDGPDDTVTLDTATRPAPAPELPKTVATPTAYTSALQAEFQAAADRAWSERQDARWTRIFEYMSRQAETGAPSALVAARTSDQVTARRELTQAFAEDFRFVAPAVAASAVVDYTCWVLGSPHFGPHEHPGSWTDGRVEESGRCEAEFHRQMDVFARQAEDPGMKGPPVVIEFSGTSAQLSAEAGGQLRQLAQEVKLGHLQRHIVMSPAHMTLDMIEIRARVIQEALVRFGVTGVPVLIHSAQGLVPVVPATTPQVGAIIIDAPR